MKSYYEVLGVSENAPQASIRQTYYRLLKIYHPDHNSDPQAHRRTLEITEAYAVIGDPAKRAEYDSSLRRAGTTDSQSAKSRATSAQENAALQKVICQKCKRQDATLRSSMMVWVGSLIFFTRRGGKSGVWCARCRTKQAWTWSTITGLFGWWGFPYGPIYTIPALLDNARGGKQDKHLNASLLRLVGYQLYQGNNPVESYRALTASLELETDPATENFRNLVQAALPPGLTDKKQLIWTWLTAAPSLLSTAFSALILFFAFNQPTGYAARYQQPEAVESKPSSRTHQTNSQVNNIADELASAVEEHATPVGSHAQGATTIREFQLERSKYDADAFARIAAQAETLLGNPTANANGIVTSIFFNAKMMEQSISVLNDFENGTGVSAPIQEVHDLGNDDRLRTWLFSSAYLGPYKRLLTSLSLLEKFQRAGADPVTDKSRLAIVRQQLAYEKSQISAARAAGDASLESVAVRDFNAYVDRYNTIVKRRRNEAALYNMVDLDFNKCLDPAILMSKFQQVDLTSNQQNSEMPDAEEITK